MKPRNPVGGLALLTPLCLAFVPAIRAAPNTSSGAGPCPNPILYCTSNPTSGGCIQKMSFTGTPSLSSPLGFVVTCTNVETGKFGVQLFGTTGESATPFSNGVLCVNPPLYRLKIKNAGGMGSCGGSLAYTLADVLANPTGGPLVIVGQKVNQQGWVRDPASLVLTAVTDGLEYIACP